MARKVKPYTIQVEKEGYRDNGKIFILTEMAAIPAGDWAIRLLMAMVEAGVDLPEDIYETGMAGVAAVGFKALLTIKWETAKVLMDEMMRCVQIQRDPKNPGFISPLLEDDIEEVKTVMLLKSQVFELHTGFSMAGALSHLISRLPPEAIKNTSTSSPSSEPSSQADLPL